MTAAARAGESEAQTRAALLAEALRLGFGRATVDAVTRRLSVAHGTLYKHFASMVALKSAMASRVLGEVLPLPGGDPSWREHLAELASVLVAVVSAHPGLREVLDAGAAAGAEPAELAAARRRATELLVRSGFRGEDAAVGVHGVLVLAVGPAGWGEARTVAVLLDGLAARLAGRAGDPR